MEQLNQKAVKLTGSQAYTLAKRSIDDSRNLPSWDCLEKSRLIPPCKNYFIARVMD